MKKIIFLVHTGEHDYLKVCIDHLRNHISDAEVVLLGDQEKSEKYPGVTLSSLKGKETELDDKYVHISPNAPEYELFCIKRWFYIRDYMRQNGINRAAYIDSDVLLNELPDSYYEDIDRYYYSCDSGHTSIFSLKHLEALCDLIVGFYSSTERIEKLKDIQLLRASQGLSGAISDMTFISMYGLKICQERADNLCHIHNMSFFDHRISGSDGFEVWQKSKAVYYHDGCYFLRENITGEYVRAASLHFQGQSKKHMNAMAATPDGGDKMYIFDYANNTWIESNQRVLTAQKTSGGGVLKFAKKVKNRVFGAENNSAEDRIVH